MAGTSKCPFCGAECHPRHFACPAHWAGMTEAGRAAVWRGKADYDAGRISLERFRDLQQEVLDAEGGAAFDSRGNPVARAGREPATRREVTLAQLACRYVRLRREFQLIKPQLTKAKGAAGRALAKCEKDLLVVAAAVLHPEETQLKLFDDTGEPGAKGLPD